jgi:hypothetical protein
MSIPGAATTAPQRPAPSADGFIPSNSDNLSLFDEQTIDNMMHVLIALGAEVWTMRRRMYVTEKVLEKAGVSAHDIENYRPTAEDKAAWTAERDSFVARTFDALSRKGGANAEQLDTYRP